jgi:hypothetical protein
MVCSTICTRYGPGMQVDMFLLLYCPSKRTGWERHLHRENNSSFWVYIKAKKPFGPLHVNERYEWNAVTETWEVIRVENWKASKVFLSLQLGIKKSNIRDWGHDMFIKLKTFERYRNNLEWWERPNILVVGDI